MSEDLSAVAARPIKHLVFEAYMDTAASAAGEIVRLEAMLLRCRRCGQEHDPDAECVVRMHGE